MQFISKGVLSLVAAAVCAAPVLAADPAREFGMRGSISLDKRTEVVTFGLKVGGRDIYYKVDGLAQPNMGLYETDTTLDAIEVSKVGRNSNGRGGEEILDTGGTIQVFPRKRKLSDVTIAGLRAKGQFIQGAINDGIFVDDLEIDGKDSRGLMDYNNFNGYYHAKRGLRFGDQKIASQISGSTLLMNHDNVIGQNRTTVTMVFGDLKVSGRVFFSDTTRTTVDSEGDSSTETVATVGRYDLAITKVDGSRPELALPGQEPTADDLTLRKLIAFYVLFSYDMLH
jgi:hypothetical protein